jgi:hypothetical protein
VAFVQKAIEADTSGSGATSLQTAAPSVATTTGNFLVALVSMGGAVVVSTFIDSAGNTYTKAVAQSGGGTTWWTSEIWYCANATAVPTGTGWWKATNGSSTDIGITVLEYSGMGSTPTVSTTGKVNQSSSASGWTVTSSGSATAGDLVVAMAACDTGTFTVPGGYNSRATPAGGSSPNIGAGDILSASSGVQSAAFTVSPNKDGSGAIACFTPSGGGGGATAVPVFMNQYRQRWR